MTALEPSTAHGLRDRLLGLIGYDESKQAKLLKASIDTLTAQLTAMRTQRLVVRSSRETEEVVSFEDAALDIRHRAATALIELVGGAAGRAAATSQAPTAVQVVVNLAPMPGASAPRAVVLDAKSAPIK